MKGFGVFNIILFFYSYCKFVNGPKNGSCFLGLEWAYIYFCQKS